MAALVDASQIDTHSVVLDQRHLTLSLSASTTGLGI